MLFLSATVEHPRPAKAMGRSAFGWNTVYVLLIDGCDREEVRPG